MYPSRQRSKELARLRANVARKESMDPDSPVQQTPGKKLPGEGAPSGSAESGFLGSRFSVRVLCLLMLLYIPVQWIVGRHPGSTSIFSHEHRDVERQFLSM